MNNSEININDSVRVRLTKEGIARYRKYYCDLAASGKVPLKDIMPVLEPDPEGWVEFQLWHLMHIFGPEMHNGNPRQMFAKNKMRAQAK